MEGTTPPLDDDRAFAEHWAPRLFPDQPDAQSRWIAHYLRVCRRDWWWTISDEHDGVRRVLCLLGPSNPALLYDGRTLRAYCIDLPVLAELIGKPIDPAELNPTTRYWRLDGIALQLTRYWRLHGIALQRPASPEAIRECFALVAQPDHDISLSGNGILSSLIQVAREYAQIESNLDYEFYDVGAAFRTALQRQQQDMADRRPTETARTAFRHARSRYYLRRIGATLREFRAQFPQDVVRTLHEHRLFDPKFFNWVVDGNTNRRLQALNASPLVVPSFFTTYDYRVDGLGQIRKDAALIDDLSVTVDQGLPLVPHLARILKVPKNAVSLLHRQERRLTGLWAANAADLPFTTLPRFLRWFHRLPGNRRPTTRAQWAGALRFFRAYRAFIPDHGYSTILTGAPLAFDHPFYDLAVQRAKDVQDAFELVGLPNKNLLNSLSWALPKLLRFERDVHRHRARIRTQLHTEFERQRRKKDQPPDGVTWPGLLPEGAVDLPGGWRAVELTTPAALSDEADALHHCVDSYATACLEGECRIVSILRPDGERASTVEFGLAPHPTKSEQDLVVQQHQAIYGAMPEAETQRILDALLRHLRHTAINRDWRCEPELLDYWYNGQSQQNTARLFLRSELDQQLYRWLSESPYASPLIGLISIAAAAQLHPSIDAEDR